ncbi:protein phosphatase 2C domain-containing protein [Streptomyces sp. NPDC017179]|uniref:protein phosphatase 2C domain-containing protein n=1 Tax=Streptomyces sp. NPDC017179 TaxID=3364979 RepID=UPI00379CB665
MSQHGGSPTGQEDDWWGQLYNDSAGDTGPASEADTLDDRFASATGTLGAPSRGTAPPTPDNAPANASAPERDWWRDTPDPTPEAPPSGTARSSAPAEGSVSGAARDSGPEESGRSPRPSAPADAPTPGAAWGSGAMEVRRAPGDEADSRVAGDDGRPASGWAAQPPAFAEGPGESRSSGPTESTSWGVTGSGSGGSSPGNAADPAGPAARRPPSSPPPPSAPPWPSSLPPSSPPSASPSAPASPPPSSPPRGSVPAPASSPPSSPPRGSVPAPASPPPSSPPSASPSAPASPPPSSPPRGSVPAPASPPSSSPSVPPARSSSPPASPPSAPPFPSASPDSAAPPPPSAPPSPPEPPAVGAVGGSGREAARGAAYAAPDARGADLTVRHVGARPPTYAAEPTALPMAEPEGLDDVVPDTVLDGAAYGSCTVRAVSVRGDSARYRGESRRDAMLTARFGAGDQALVLVAMATGARAAPGAHRAAAEVCRWIAEAVGRSHARLTEDIRAARRGDLKSGLHRLTDRSLGRLRADAAGQGVDPGQYSAGLRCLLLPADPECRVRVFFGVGPGGLFRLRAGEWQDIEPGVAETPGHPVVGFGSPPPETPDGDRLTIDLGITTPPNPYDPAPEPPREPFRFRASVAQPGDTLLMCTAGLADPLRGEPELCAHLARRWSDPAPPGLAAFLADAQARVKGYADDRTAAAVWEA